MLISRFPRRIILRCVVRLERDGRPHSSTDHGHVTSRHSTTCIALSGMHRDLRCSRVYAHAAFACYAGVDQHIRISCVTSRVLIHPRVYANALPSGHPFVCTTTPATLLRDFMRSTYAASLLRPLIRRDPHPDLQLPKHVLSTRTGDTLHRTHTIAISPHASLV